MKIYYGSETKKALKNFDFKTDKVNMDFIFSIVKIKKAAALANYKALNIDLSVKNAIVIACDEILDNSFKDQFILSYFQGGAGTAINMNINEVLANRATEILNNKKVIHPNDDVNCSQSTNDVNPSGLRVSSYFLLDNLISSLDGLIVTLKSKEKEFKNIHQLGRTHLQDAVPMTLGSLFSSYLFNLEKNKKNLIKVKNLTLILNLGGTAIGNSVNANHKYIKEVYLELNKILGVNFVKSKNLMAQTGSLNDFLEISQAVVSLSVYLSKIASDIRLMSSGPYGGFGEITLPEVQKGSSIMPGKINPVIAESVNQLYYLVSGNNLMIEKAVEASQLELGVMFPIVAHKLSESISLTSEVVLKFNHFCIKDIKVNKEKCLSNLENSTAYATLFVPSLGYDLVCKIVEKSVKSKRTLREIIINDKYLSNKEFDHIVDSFLKVL